MTDRDYEKLKKIEEAIQSFSSSKLYESSITLYKALDYQSNKTVRLSPATFDGFIDSFNFSKNAINKEKALASHWNQVEFIFQVADSEITRVQSLFDTGEVDKNEYQSFLFFTIQLKEESYKRSELVKITRELNVPFKMPVIVLFHYGNKLTLSIIDRRLHKKDTSKDVLEKVTLIKDIDITNPQRAHKEILKDLSLNELYKKFEFHSFVKLHEAWKATLNISELNKKFFRELANWYFWAIDNVSFPDDLEKKKEVRNATNLIRLITRVVFIWFIKEKSLVPNALFNQSHLDKILKDFNKDKKSQNYYHAILQNLFFGTLNQKMDERKFAKDGGSIKTNGEEYGVKNLFRYADLFNITEKEVLALFKDVPFLNGGLFDCLDKPNEEGKIVYVDGFSRNPKKQAIVPDYIFFGEEREVDLNDIFATRNKKYKSRGLINLLESYKFTVAENTPIEEEIALDPELLGKVFENLLASYNPETQTTARKQTGSFYTPREIVNYMVDESLLEYIKSSLSIPTQEEGTLSIPAQEESTLNIPAQEESTLSIPAQEESTLSIPTQEESKLSIPAQKESKLSIPAQKESKLSTDAFENYESFFNPFNEIEIHQGNLPHWQQESVWYFITFRLADSLPKEVVEEIKIKREEWLKRKSNLKPENLSLEEKKEYYRLFSGRMEELLNAGKGSCILKEPKIAKILANTLVHFNNNRYVLDEWVIMPNHVHVLVKPLGDNKLPEILHTWKSFSANEINKITGNKGQLWMHESYDHIVRNEKALDAIRNYIRQNPVKANLKEGQYMLSARTKDCSETFETRLRELISYSETPNPFDEEETKALIEAINKCKILDPACGSGAYPMGILHKMVHLLQKLDPENKYWKALQRQKAIEETEAAFKIGDKEERAKRLAEINDVFENNASDYGRKLYLIENCIYGIDIQPIAVQISKLRFFISLIIDQKVQPSSQMVENRGIRSLPNLETKFVAANTLIGLDKPQQTLLRNPEIEVKENQLKELRHKYFTANTRKEKLQYQKQDKKLRKEIAKMLESDGWQSAVAKQIVAFDPYDQNTFAPWFDPEWMFGLTSGFDIVIGNPPYKILTKNNTDQKELSYFIKRYKSIQGSYSKNLFTLFIENAFGLQAKNSTLSFIIPEGLFKTRSYSSCVDEINKNGFVKAVVTFSNYVFENAVTGNLIFLFSKNKKGETENFHFDENFTLNKVEDRDSSLTSKIELETKPLKEVSTVFKGMVVQDRDSVLSESSRGKKNIFLLGKNISKWKINSKYYTNYTDLEIIGGTKKLEKHNQVPRILIRRTGDTLCCSYLNEKALTESTLYSCCSINSNISTKVLLGFLNSRLLDYYNKELFITNQQGFPQILMTDLELMPIKIPSKEFQNIFSTTIDFVLLQKSLDVDSGFFERLIDAIVYELYLPKEIKAGGAEVLKHLGKLPELKEGQDESRSIGIKTIEKVCKELSNPKHPVSIAMRNMQEIEEVKIIEGKK